MIIWGRLREIGGAGRGLGDSRRKLWGSERKRGREGGKKIMMK